MALLIVDARSGQSLYETRAQSDGTAWMAQFCLSMLKIAIELAEEEPEYEDIADKFLNDFIYLAAAINSTSPETARLGFC